MIFTVPMWGSEVASSKTEIHLTNTASEVMWACNVTTIEHEGTKATVGGGTPIFTGVFEPLARVTLYLTDENGLGSCFEAA